MKKKENNSNAIKLDVNKISIGCLGGLGRDDDGLYWNNISNPYFAFYNIESNVSSEIECVKDIFSDRQYYILKDASSYSRYPVGVGKVDSLSNKINGNRIFSYCVTNDGKILLSDLKLILCILNIGDTKKRVNGENATLVSLERIAESIAFVDDAAVREECINEFFDVSCEYNDAILYNRVNNSTFNDINFRVLNFVNKFVDLKSVARNKKRARKRKK